MSAALIGVLVWLGGLCVGSFLNVVVYRVPLGLSVARPLRSFCPQCQGVIAWHDNIPVLSWILLGGRCRRCHERIPARYPLIESLCGLLFVLSFHLLLVAQARAGLEAPRWPDDLPLLLAWLVLAAALLACAAMDIRCYMVDTRLTNGVLGAAIVLYALWPRQGFFAARSATPAAAAALAASLVGGLMLWLSARRRGSAGQEPHGQQAEAAQASRGAGEQPDLADGAEPAALRAAALLASAMFVALSAWLVSGVSRARADGDAEAHLAVWLSLLALFGVTVLAGGQQRAADRQIHEAIEQERPLARRTALRELLWLCPALACAAAAYLVVAWSAGAARLWSAATNWPGASDFAPLGGAVFALHGAMTGAAAGWLLRIVFTLAFGREAFGTGDIYLLAAGGAVAGWDIALLALLLGVLLALAGWLLGLVLKRGVMIPFGPWLALGFLVALRLSRPASAALRRYYEQDVRPLAQHPRMLAIVGGLTLVVSAAAIAIAHLVRRWAEPQEG